MLLFCNFQRHSSKLTTTKEKHNACRKGIQINRVTVREELERQVSQEHWAYDTVQKSYELQENNDQVIHNYLRK
jgi:hypothetical protein